jgi:hypothetical protein
MFAIFSLRKPTRLLKKHQYLQMSSMELKKLSEDNAPIAISKEIVLKVFESLKEKNCHGYDRIHLQILRDGAEPLLKPYTILFRTIISQYKIPEQWKTARIIHLHKKRRQGKS